MADRGLLVVDAGLVERSVLSIESCRRRYGIGSFDIACAHGNDIEEVEELAGRGATLIVVVGGGAVVDAVKLASLVQGGHFELSRISGPVTPPYILLRGHGHQQTPPVFAYTSTLGTGAESSDKVSLRTPNGQLTLIQSRLLKPAWGAVDLTLLESLAEDTIARGLAEVLFRVLGPILDSLPGEADQRLAGMAAEAYSVIRHGEWKEPSARSDALAAISAIGAYVHSPGVFRGGRFIGRPWYLGRTVQELIPEIPKVEGVFDGWLRWARTCELIGDDSYSARWETVRQLSAGKIAAPGGTLVNFLAEARSLLGLTFDATEGYGGIADEVVPALLRRWGGVFPMEPIQRRALTQAYAEPLDAIVSPRSAREVN